MSATRRWVLQIAYVSDRRRGDRPLIEVREFTDKAPNDVWSEAVFRWLSSTNADWCMQIQEDAIVPENFWQIVRAILEAVPEEADIVGLHVCSPLAAPLAEEGFRLFTTADALVGVCWAVRGPVMREFVEWRRTELVEGWRAPVPPKGLPALTEDTMMALFAMATSRRIYHPIPAPVDHDTSMASVWGNDDHQNRRPRVSWRDADRFADCDGPAWDPRRLERPDFWEGTVSRRRIPHVGLFYAATPLLLRQWVKGGDRLYVDAVRDDGRREKRRMVHLLRARVDAPEPKEKLLLCTPLRGRPHPEYGASVLRLSVAEDVETTAAWSLLRAHQWADDLVRVRSRFVRAMLETNATRLLFVDADVSFDPAVIGGMLQTGHDFVVAPYPNRSGINFQQIASPDDPRPVEARGYRYSMRLLPGQTALDVQPNGCAEIAGIGLGCALLSREMLETMVSHYTDLLFEDVVDGARHKTAALFQLMIRDGELLSEDNAFCQRWRDIGGQVYAYFGPGSPVSHHGEYSFRGHIGAFGLQHANA